jgi:hypothetical protein
MKSGLALKTHKSMKLEREKSKAVVRLATVQLSNLLFQNDDATMED